MNAKEGYYKLVFKRGIKVIKCHKLTKRTKQLCTSLLCGLSNFFCANGSSMMLGMRQFRGKWFKRVLRYLRKLDVNDRMNVTFFSFLVDKGGSNFPALLS